MMKFNKTDGGDSLSSSPNQKFVIIATHPVTFEFNIEAPSREEAVRLVMENEFDAGKAFQIDEGDRTIESVEIVSKFDWETAD